MAVATPEQQACRERVYAVVAAIPRGYVASYGQVAQLAGLTGRARWVGKVLSQIPADTGLPWHRVVNAQGVITCPSAVEAGKRLIAEGVVVREGRIQMSRFLWSPVNARDNPA